MLRSLRRSVGETATILKSFRGNTRTCLLVEPMWGVPFNLTAPYASLYMLALGASEAQVGLITSLGLAFQMVFAVASGHITDRLGRRKTSLLFDLVSWSIPNLIWAFAAGPMYFVAAAVINAAVRVVHTSWSCLLIEDSPPEQRVHIFSWLQVAGIIAGFTAPLAGLLVARLTLVPATRILYLFSFVSMTAMFFLRNHFTTETRIGLRKMKETPPFSLRIALADHGRVLASLVASPYTLLAFVLFVINNLHLVIRRTFFSILLTQGLGFPEAAVGLFPAIQSAVMLAVFVLAMPAIARLAPATAMASGFGAGALGYLVLVLSPPLNYALAVASAALTAYSSAVCYALAEAVLANAIEDNERAKTMAILQVFLFGISTPFGALAGVLSEADEVLPFVLLLALMAAGLVISGLLARMPAPRAAAAKPAAE